MMVSDEEKRWIVVGIAMNKVAAPVLRDAVKQGIDTNYTDMDKHCQHLSPPCTLQTLNHGLVRADPIFAGLKFQNINNNGSLYGKHYSCYNFNISDSIDLAKLYLPDYLAQFSAFDESLDLTAILRLLGFKNYMPATVFSPHIQASADDVRENVRNKWGHVDVTEWTDALFNDCFDKLKALVKSLGLTACVEKTTLDQLDDWQTKGCQLILGHAVDRDLLLLVQGEVRGLIKDYSTFEKYLATLRDQDKRKGTALDEHHKRLEVLEEKLREASEDRGKEIKKVVERLLSFERQLSKRLQEVEEKVDQLEQAQTKTDDRVSQLEQRYTEVTAKVDQLDQMKTQDDKPEASFMKTFDLKYCRSKLEDHYQKTATVPTSVWCKKSVVDIHQIYTRLSWVKEEQTPAGTTQSELKHYSDLFTADKNGAIPKRILVQGQTGIGKSTFVKKLLVDWVEVNKETGDKQTSVLKNFELVVAVNLKEVSKCQSLEDVIRMSNVFAKEDKYMTDGLIEYITNNQERVLVIFDGYDEYRQGCNSEIYEIFRGSSLRSCCVLITTRISKADELQGGEDLHAEITGFSEVDRKTFLLRFLTDDERYDFLNHLRERNLQELAKVPLLLLFFCTLWKRGQAKVFPKSKTELYTNIIQFIINHNYRKQSPPRYVTLQSSKEILSEIGKVTLQGLLNNDHLFEYSQLSDAVLCDESIFIGLLQITEHSETLQPVGMVSFIHKSIQEFLAAWYITHKCILEGGSVGEIGVKLEECLALENVFQFMCGLSEDGASMAFTHLKSVRISDLSLDLSKAIPDIEKETDVPLSDVTDRQRNFNDLVLNSFEEVKSKAGLSETCLDCLGSIFLLPSNYMKPFPEDLFLKLRDASTLSFIFEYRELRGTRNQGHIQLNRMIDVTERVTESSEIQKLRNFLIGFRNISSCCCRFSAVLCMRNGQVYFYIKHLEMACDLHPRLITDNVASSHPAHSSLRQPFLKYLKTLYCFKPDDEALCPFLQQVPNPSRCTLSIKRCDLTSKGAVKLAYLLPMFGSVTHLDLSLAFCSAESVTRLVAAIKHKTLKKLELSKIMLTSAVAESLGQSLPECSALDSLKISGSDGCSLQDKEMEALFGRFNRPSPLVSLVIDHFSLRGRLSVVTKNLHFFHLLEYLDLSITVDKADFFGLLENLKLLPKLKHLTLKGIALRHSVRSLVPQLLKLKKLETLCLKTESFSKEELLYVLDAFKGRLRQLQIGVANYGKASQHLGISR